MAKLNLKKIRSAVLISFLLVSIFLVFSSQAQALQIKDYPSFLNIRAGMTLTELVSMIFNFLLMVAGLAAFIMIVWGGVKYLTSAGDPSKMGDAKNQIFSAILGLIIMLASWMILNTINPQLVELREPGVPSATPATPVAPPVVAGVCADGQTYAVELYSGKNYSGDRRCYNTGDKEASYTYKGKIYSIRINGAAIKLFDEANFSGKNICFQGSVPDLHRCILAGANDCNPFGYAGWEKPGSLQIVSGCAEPGVTLSFDGKHIGEKCIFGDEIDIPVCIYQ